MMRLVAAALALALAASAYGEVGDLTLKACDPAMSGGWSLDMAPGQNIRPAPADCGTINPGAKIITLRGPQTGNFTLRVALDSAKADAKVLDVLRVDAAGAGRFTSQASVAFQWPAADGSGLAALGPLTVPLIRDGYQIPVTIRGYVSGTSSAPAFLRLQFGSCMEGRCEFGGVERSVRIVDATGNMRMDDPLKVTFNAASQVQVVRGDEVLVEVGKGEVCSQDAGPVGSAGYARFRNAGGYGQPIQVAGSWYDLSVSDDGSRVSARPLKGSVGRMKVDGDEWSATLAGPGRLFTVEGGKDDVDVPAGKYIIQAATLQKDRVLLVLTDRGSSQGKSGMIEVAPGRPVENPFGPPLTTKVEVRKTGREVTLEPLILDAGGRSVTRIIFVSQPTRETGQIEVRDAGGRVVLSAALQFA